MKAFIGLLMCSLPALLGEVENPLEPEDEVSELGEEAICVMADMAVRLEDMPDMLCMLCMFMPCMLIPVIDGNMVEPDITVILLSVYI